MSTPPDRDDTGTDPPATDPASFRTGGAWQRPLLRRHAASPESLPLEPGARIGPYRVLRVLGQGGMATVYAAERVEGGFTQQVALKTIRAAGAGDSELLFRRERNILAGLEHPGIARLLDGGQTPDGAPWFAMQWVVGLRIDAYVVARQLDTRGVVRLLIAACQAVQYAHDRLAAHRDIKPSNVLVDAQGELKLLDFGIAGLLEQDEHGVPLQPDPAAGAHTPGYASPEQLRGESGSGIATDVWQLGVLLRELLGRRGVAAAERDLAAIVARATSPLVADRYARVSELLADLEHWLRFRPVQARQGGALYRLGRFLRRQRLPVAIATLALLALLTLGWTSLAQIRAARDRAEQQAQTATQVSSFLASVFNAASPYANAGKEPTVGEVLAAGVARIETDLADQPRVRGELQYVLGRVYVTMNQMAKARPLLEAAVAQGASDPELPPLALAQRLRHLGVVEQSADERPLAARHFQQALALLDPVRADPVAARERNGLQRNLALQRYQEGDIAGAVRMQRAALDDALAQFGPEDLQVARARANLGQFLAQYDGLAEARPMLEEALHVLEAQRGPTHPETIAIKGALGGALVEHGELAAGLPLLEAGVKDGLDTIAPDSPWYPLQLSARGWTHLQAGRLAEAEPDLVRALALAEALPPADDFNSVSILQGLGELRLRQDRAAEAVALFQRALERNRDNRHAIRIDTGERPLWLAEALIAAGDCAAARPVLAQALALLEQRTTERHPLRAHWRAVAARCP